MGLPVFRFTLSHANLGSIQISEPDGWKDAKLKMERHPDFHSLVEYFEGSFIFYGENNFDNGGADFIRQVENLYGLDAQIDIDIDVTFDGDNYESIFNGQLDLTGLQEVKDNKIEVPIIRNDFWAKFIARKDTPVNLRSTTDLDGNARSVIDLVDVNLTAQKVRQNYSAFSTSSGSTSNDIAVIVSGTYYQMSFDNLELDEIEEIFIPPQIDNTILPAPWFEPEYAGTYTFEFLTVAYDYDPPYSFGIGEDLSDYIQFYLNVDGVEIPFQVGYLINEGLINGGRTYTLNYTTPLNAGSKVYLYGKAIDDLTVGIGSYTGEIRWNGPVVGLAFSDDVHPYARISSDTTYPSSSGQTYLIHDAANSITDRVIGRSNTFYSEYFGGTTTNGRSYSSDGCGWKNILIQGLQLRGYTFDEKQFAMSFEKWWKGANPIFNLGLGYDTILGQEVIRVEEKEYFYDPTTPLLFVENVREISREYDHSRIYNKIEVGYTKWQSEDISGLDDPQTKRVYATRIQKINNSLQIQSDFIAASLAIEVTRRQKIEQSKDYKYDNDVFIIAINGDDVSPDRYRPETNENFNSITGLLNSDTRYNSIHTPLRMTLRWGNYINGCLQKYQSSSLKFVSGEGNYDMQSDYSCASGDQCMAVICDNLSEKQDLSLTAYGGVFGFIHLPLLYTIEIIDFSWDDYLLIRNNRRKSIAVSQTLDNFKRFFIKELTYEICKSKCKMVLWPYDEAPILVIDTLQPDRPSEPPFEEDCGDRVRLLEDGDERITEDGECRNLEDGATKFFYQEAEGQPAEYIYHDAEIPPAATDYFYQQSEL